MNYVITTTPTPIRDTVMHLLYLDKDGELSERLILVTSADATHWKGTDLVKNEFRCFRRASLFWAKPVTDSNEQHDVFYRLLVRQLHTAQTKN